jgi:DNA-directed RNA polymerase specialized sigma subunit
MTAKEFLSQAWQIDRRIEKKCEERDRLLARLTAGRLAHLTGMPRGGSGADWTDAVARLIDMDNAINGEIMELCRLKREINAAIEAVEDMRYRRVLELRYRNYMRWEDIAEEMGYEVRHVTRLHGEALACVRIPSQNVLECPAR